MSLVIARRNALRQIAGGIAAVSTKELRGRMRGRRAFVLLTVHLVAVSGFAFFVEEIAVRSSGNAFGGVQSADIGRALFTALLFFLTIVVLILGPASTSGAISLEREKQTLDMLITTPVSSLAIVLGKLVAALGWMALLLLGSIPVLALVFMFGGVGPEDLVRAYVVLATTALLYGSLGLFVSALFKRTQAATVLNLVLALVMTLGTGGLFGGLSALAFADLQQRSVNMPVDWTQLRLPPQAMLWANPFVADLDVLCHSDTSMSGSCAVVLFVTGRIDLAQGGQAMAVQAQPLPAGGFAGDGPGVQVAAPQNLGMPEDSYWPVSVAAMLVLSMLLIAGTTQLISPTRRWRRPRRGHAMAAVGGVLFASGAVLNPDADAAFPTAEVASVDADGFDSDADSSGSAAPDAGPDGATDRGAGPGAGT